MAQSERESRTEYVVLAMLLMGPATGYGVRQRITSSVGNFWQESFGQLYPALQALAKHGLARKKRVKVGKRSADEFSITTAGTRALTAWVGRAPRLAPERNELLLKLFVASLDVSAVRAHLVAARELAGAESTRFEQMKREMRRELRAHPDLPLWLATVDYGLAVNRALSAWSTKAIRALASKRVSGSSR